jgi:hypothetical protein
MMWPDVLLLGFEFFSILLRCDCENVATSLCVCEMISLPAVTDFEIWISDSSVAEDSCPVRCEAGTLVE